MSRAAGGRQQAATAGGRLLREATGCVGGSGAASWTEGRAARGSLYHTRAPAHPARVQPQPPACLLSNVLQLKPELGRKLHPPVKFSVSVCYFTLSN